MMITLHIVIILNNQALLFLCICSSVFQRVLLRNKPNHICPCLHEVVPEVKVRSSVTDESCEGVISNSFAILSLKVNVGSQVISLTFCSPLKMKDTRHEPDISNSIIVKGIAFSCDK